MNTKEISVPLLILRIGLGAFLLLFGIDKLVAPQTSVDVFAQFYGIAAGTGTVYLAGGLEVVLALAILAGAWKTLSYGLGFLVHALSTAATWRELLSPFGEGHLFVAAIPVLAAFLALFLLRRHDTLLSAGG